MLFLHQAWTIAMKDLRSEFRTKESINASLSFSVVILLLFSFAFDPGAETTREIAGGLLWLVFAFAGALVLNRGFARELQNDCLEALVSSPISGAALFLGKTLASFVLLVSIEAFCMPVFGIFYNVRWWLQLPQMIVVLLLATWGMTVLGTMFSALTVNLRLRELMLPMLLYPMLIPALMAAMKLSTTLIAGTPLGDDDFTWLKMLIGFDIIFSSLALALVEIVLVR